MLVRAAGRNRGRHASRQLTAEFQQLYLPFLCPAQLRWTATRAVTKQPELRKPSVSVTPDRPRSRHLASIAGPVENRPLNGDGPHYGASSPNLYWDFERREPRTRLPHQPLLLKHNREEVSTPPYRNGIGGDKVHLITNLHTCLRVNRFDRAELIIRRLSEDSKVTNNELREAHEAYLEARLEELATYDEPEERLDFLTDNWPAMKEQKWQAMKQWFMEEVVENNIPISERSQLAMLKAAATASQFSDAQGDVQDVLRILDMHGKGITDSPDLTDEEFLRLGAVQQNEQPDESQLAAVEKEAQVMEEQTEINRSVIPGGLPKVLGVAQKGRGLQSLKDGLKVFETDAFKKELLHGLEGFETEREAALERERQIEDSAAEAAVLRWKAEDEQMRSIGINGALQSRSLGALMWQWYSALLPKVHEELKEVRKALESKTQGLVGSDKEERKLYGAQLESVPAETIAASTILFVMSMISRGKDRESDKYDALMKLTMVTHTLGRQIQQESNAEATKKRAALDRKRDVRTALKAGKRSLSKAKPDQANQGEGVVSLEWPLAIRVKIGAMLVSKLIETAQMPITRQHPRTKEEVTQMQPAFLHKILYRIGKKQGYLTPSPDLVEKIHREPQGSLICKRLPMVVEPRPWKGFLDGGYLRYSTPFIRFPPTDQTPKDYAIAAINKGDMNQVFDALNVLSRIPWEINDDVLKVQIEAWNSGEPVGNFAPLNPQMSLPPEPAASSDPTLRRKWLADAKDIENKKAGMHSQRCHQNFQLEIARAFRGETVYFPHNIDFRGRAYPVPPYLNHMGADNARALMRFAKGKELGVSGLRWLKIHLSNVFGYDKASLQEREEFVMEHLADIYDSAANPLSGGRWWAKSEDAWQTLAACCELRDALESPDPTKFVSHLPIHQDGTCNGLQHYAALGGDEIGARQVNLEPSDRPSDVYTAVAEAVKAEVEKDFNDGNPIAKILHGKITRKVVKQPVMTNVYGVTYYGAKEQVQKQIEEIFPHIHRSELINHLTLSAYVAKKIFKSLGEMFRGAQDIQEWLGKCADRISTCVTKEQIDALRNPEPGKKKPRKHNVAIKKAKQSSGSSVMTSRGLFKSSVIWTTPMRLPVVQPYRSPKRQLVKTSLQSIALQEPMTWDPVSKRKQMQGFPPNFIHSLDATHMMLSALKCDEQGMTFASIHDSFWTHACDIDHLSEVLRDAFVHMHSDNVVGRLRQEFVARYQDSMYLAVVDYRSAIGKNIKAHQKEITIERNAMATRLGGAKMPQFQIELLMEHERLELLKSSDPKKRKRGEEMVTPGSIFAAAPDESSFAVPTELADAKLGAVPEDASFEEYADSDAAAEYAEAGIDDDERDEEDSDEYQDILNSDEENRSESDIRLALLNGKEKASPEARAAEKRQKVKSYRRKVYVWLPLTFPEVPKKGNFDVTRLKQSRYFFH